MVSCDQLASYSFAIKNDTSNQIQLIFENYFEEQKDTVLLSPNEEKVVTIITGSLNSPAHDCLHEHGMTYFQQLIFDTYINGEKIGKQFWHPDNWKFSSLSNWSANYSMTLTNELIEIE